MRGFFSLKKVKQAVTTAVIGLAVDAYAAVDSLKGVSHHHYPCAFDQPQGVFEIAESGFYYLIRLQQSAGACASSVISDLQKAIPTMVERCAGLTQYEEAPRNAIVHRDWQGVGPTCAYNKIRDHCHAGQSRELVASKAVNTSLPVIQKSVECIEEVISEVVDNSQSKFWMTVGITAAVLFVCCASCCVCARSEKCKERDEIYGLDDRDSMPYHSFRSNSRRTCSEKLESCVIA